MSEKQQKSLEQILEDIRKKEAEERARSKQQPERK
jgi:hypothetical protein